MGREKVQGLGSGRFVPTGEWWGSGDRLWSLMKSWYILSAIYLFVLVRSWAEVVAFMSPMMRGVQFLFSLIMVIRACISKREACASGPESQLVPMTRRFASAVFRTTEVCLPSGSECTSEQFVARAMHLRTQTVVPPLFLFVEVHHL